MLRFILKSIAVALFTALAELFQPGRWQRP